MAVAMMDVSRNDRKRPMQILSIGLVKGACKGCVECLPDIQEHQLPCRNARVGCDDNRLDGRMCLLVFIVGVVGGV
jgi:hypothetical protein